MKVFVFLLLIPAVLGTGGMVGGYAYASLSEPETQRMAKVSLRELNKKENSVRKLVEILSAKTQVVAGVNYNFVLHVKNGEQDEICEVTLYVAQWLHQQTVTHDECKLTKRKVGAEEPASEAEVKEAVLLATDYHNVKLNSLFREGAQGVENIRKQTVAGILYTFTVNFMPTHCFNDGTSLGKDLDECPVNKEGTETKCTYKVLFQYWMTPKYTVKNETCGQRVPQPVPGVKSEMVTKLKNSLKEHDKPKLNEFMLPSNMLPIADANKELSNHIVPLNRQKKSVDNLQPLMQHIGKSVFEALKNVKKETPEMNDKAKEDLDKLLGKDDHDLVQHGLEKLLGGDGHDLLKHGIEQLLGGDGHDLHKHGLDQLLGGDNHDLVKHGLANLLGGDGHDLKNHGNLIGGDDHDFKKHGGLIGGDDHDFKKHGGLIGGDEHDFKKHGGLIGGDDHDFKKHGSLIGGDDHDLKPHGTKNSAKIGGDDHDLCHLGHFKEFIIKHGKSYETVDEENKRFGIFCENMAFARKLNETEQGTAVYGATKFADLTPMEFRHKYLSKKNWDDIPNHGASKMWRAKIPKGSPPSSFDWRSLGAVTAVKNQGQCGSCWAFSTTGNIEGQWKIKQGNLVSLSEQELVDCDKLDDGCEGGLPSNAYQSIMKLGGLETEGEYKYDGADEKCKFNKTEVAVTITGAVNISQNEADMAAWLAANGPISIGINANAMQFYFGGISHPWKIFCNPASLDHGVLIVGYGTEGSEPFWIVKNSWGPDWGEKGYYRVYRGGGVCGLNRMCTSAVVN